jgi:hypothetical protein
MNPTRHRNKWARLPYFFNFVMEKGKTFSVLPVRASDILRVTQTYQIFMASYVLLKKKHFFKIKKYRKEAGTFHFLQDDLIKKF